MTMRSRFISRMQFFTALPGDLPLRFAQDYYRCSRLINKARDAQARREEREGRSWPANQLHASQGSRNR